MATTYTPFTTAIDPIKSGYLHQLENAYQYHPESPVPVAGISQAKITDNSVPVIDASTNIVYYPSNGQWLQNSVPKATGYTSNPIQMSFPKITSTTTPFTGPTGTTWYPFQATSNGQTAGWGQSTNPNAGGYIQNGQQAYTQNNQLFQQQQAKSVDPSAYQPLSADTVAYMHMVGPGSAPQPYMLNGQAVYQSVNPNAPGYIAQYQINNLQPEVAANSSDIANYKQTVAWQADPTNPQGTNYHPPSNQGLPLWASALILAAGFLDAGSLADAAGTLTDTEAEAAGITPEVAQANGFSSPADMANSIASGNPVASTPEAPVPAEPTPTPEAPVTPTEPTPTPEAPVTPVEPTPAPTPEAPIPAEPTPTPEAPVTPAESTPAPTPVEPTPTEPTGPVQPSEATTPVSEGPQVPNGPQAPTNITSTGVSDSAPGTVYTDPATGTQEVVLDSGKTVNLADYQAAQASGQPISVDGQMTTGDVTVHLQTTPEPVPTGPVTPTTSVEPTPGNAPPPNYSEMTVNDSGDVIDKVTGENYGPAADNGFTPQNNGLYTAPDGTPVAPTNEVAAASQMLGLTPTQIIALGGVAAATAVVATMGSGGASTAANAVLNPSAAPTAPVTPTPVTPTPITPTPVTPTPVTPTPVTPTPVTPGGPGTTTTGTSTPAPGGTGITPGGSGTTPGAINPGTPTSPTGTAPGTLSPGTPSGPYTPQPTVPGTQGGVAPTVTPPGPGNPVQITDYSTPYQTPDGQPLDTSGWSATDIAKALAAGYIINAVLNPTVTPAPNYKQQFLPIPTYNASGLVNPGVNPGFIQPAPMYNNGGQAGIDQYYWGQHGYAQNMADLANYNTGAVNAPSVPYGNPNAVNLGHLLTPEQLGYPSQQSMSAVYGPGYQTPDQQIYQQVLANDVYHNTVQMNTATPPVPGTPQAYGPNTQQNMAVGQGLGQLYGKSLNYNQTPAQLATVNNSGMVQNPTNAGTTAAQLTSISPSELSAQLIAAANAAGNA